MIRELPPTQMPEWLRGPAHSFGPLPLPDLFSRSVFYPACEFDGKPVAHLGGEYFSFVYADYGVRRSETFKQLTTFAGYLPAYVREVTKDELAPNGWADVTQAAIRARVDLTGIPAHDFFALWAILERSPSVPSEHGPDRFSLLYVGFEGVATYRSIYCGNDLTPGVIAVIHPGGFGGNYTDFENEEELLALTVGTSPAGIPPYLLNDWRGGPQEPERACWPSTYPLRIRELPDGLRLWGRSSGTRSAKPAT